MNKHQFSHYCVIGKAPKVAGLSLQQNIVVCCTCAYIGQSTSHDVAVIIAKQHQQDMSI